MKIVEISFKAKVEDSAIEELKRAVDHHIEHLLDVDNWPEIKTVYSADIKVEGE